MEHDEDCDDFQETVSQEEYEKLGIPAAPENTTIVIMFNLKCAATVTLIARLALVLPALARG